MKEKKYFTPAEKSILRVMYKQKISFTIYEVAKEAKVSYPTAKKYIEKLLKEGLLKGVDYENKSY